MNRPLLFLSPLHRAGRQVPISEITRVFGLKKSTMTSLLDRLEERGLLARHPHPDDGRSFLVELTAEGRRLAEQVQEPVDDLERSIGERVRERDIQGFHRVLEAIHEVTGIEVRSEAPKEERP
jgi:DNA-binding MarR family transcriptional regulator